MWPELKPRANALLRIVSMVFVLVFALVFVWYGIKFVQFGWNQTSELADMPMRWIFVAWPLTGLTWLLFGFERLRADLRIVDRRPRAGSGRAAASRDRHRERAYEPARRMRRGPPRRVPPGGSAASAGSK